MAGSVAVVAVRLEAGNSLPCGEPPAISSSWACSSVRSFWFHSASNTSVTSRLLGSIYIAPAGKICLVANTFHLFGTQPLRLVEPFEEFLLNRQASLSTIGVMVSTKSVSKANSGAS
jgi:hypothetical protein